MYHDFGLDRGKMLEADIQAGRSTILCKDAKLPLLWHSCESYGEYYSDSQKSKCMVSRNYLGHDQILQSR